MNGMRIIMESIYYYYYILFYSNSEICRIPQYLIEITTPTQLYAKLSSENINIHLGMSLIKSDIRVPHSSQPEDKIIIHTTSFSNRIKEIVTKKLEVGKYVFIPQTYRAEEVGQFKANIQSAEMIKVTRIPYYEENRINYIINSEWSSSNGTNAGCRKYQKYEKNPKFIFEVNEDNTKISASLFSDEDISKGMRMSIFEYNSSKNITPEFVLSKTSSLYEFPEKFYLSDTRVIYSDHEVELRNGNKYIIVPSTYNPIESKFKLTLMSNKKLNFINVKPKIVKKEKMIFGKINQNINITRGIIYPSTINQIPESLFTHKNPDTICSYEEMKLLYNEIDNLNNKLNNNNNNSIRDNSKVNSPLDSSLNNTKISSLQLEIEELKDKNIREMNNYKNEIEKLKNENISLNDKIYELNNKISQSPRIRTPFRSPINSLNLSNNNENSILEETINKLHSELDEIKVKYNELKDQLNINNIEKQKLNSTIVLLKSQIISLQSDNESIENYKKQIQSLEQSNSKLKNNINELQILLNDVLNNNTKIPSPPPPPRSENRNDQSPRVNNISPLKPSPEKKNENRTVTNDNLHPTVNTTKTNTKKVPLTSTPIVEINHKIPNKDAKPLLPPSKLRNVVAKGDNTTTTTTTTTNNNNNPSSRLRDDSKISNPNTKIRSVSKIKKPIPALPSLHNGNELPKPSNLKKGVVNNIKKESHGDIGNASPIQSRIKKA